MIDIFWLKLLRIIIVFIGCVVTGLKPDTSSGFFKNLLIFSAGLVYDYSSLASVAFSLENKLKRNYSYQRKVSSIGVIASLIFLVLAIIGLFNVILLDIDSGNAIIRTSNDFIAWSFQIEMALFARIMYIFPFIAFLEIFNKHERALTLAKNTM